MDLEELKKFKPKIINIGLEAFLEQHIYTYAGGLGILEGDKIRTAADMRLPIMYVILASRGGYGKQKLDSHGWQHTDHSRWDPEDHCKKLDLEFKINYRGEDNSTRDINFGFWLYDKIKGATGFSTPVVLIDSFVESNNNPWDKNITTNLYGTTWGVKERPKIDILQRVALGIGSTILAEKLGVLNSALFHMNEGHAVFSALELLKRNDWDLNRIKKQFVFTTHTPVDAGIDRSDYGLISHHLRQLLPENIEEFKKIGGGYENKMNAAELALNLSKKGNAVSLLHSKVSNEMFHYVKNREAFPIVDIVNGVHSTTWTSEGFAKLYDKYAPGWRNDPTILKKIKNIENNCLVDFWHAHQQNKNSLIDYVKDYIHGRKELGAEFDNETFTIGFARRAVEYKQAEFLFSDIERLKSIAKKYGKLQLVFAGNAHSADDPSKKIIQNIYERSRWLKDHNISLVYLENYNSDLAKILVSGADLWLATSVIEREASGTSGMKAAHNGVPSLSVRDGWWYERNQSVVTGWDILDAKDMYNTIEDVILPMFHGKGIYSKGNYAEIMRNAIVHNASYFNTHRMMKDYFEKVYELDMDRLIIK